METQKMEQLTLNKDGMRELRGSFTADWMRQGQAGYQECATITTSWRMGRWRSGGGRVRVQSKNNKVHGTKPSFSKTIHRRIHVYACSMCVYVCVCLLHLYTSHL